MIYRTHGNKEIGSNGIDPKLRDLILYDADEHSGFLYIPDHKPADHKVRDRFGKNIGNYANLIMSIAVQLDCSITKESILPTQVLNTMSHNKWCEGETVKVKNPFVTVLGNIIDAHIVPQEDKLSWEDCDKTTDHSAWLLESVGVRADSDVASLLYLILTDDEIRESLYCGLKTIWLELTMQMENETIESLMQQVLYYIMSRYTAVSSDLYELRDHQTFYVFMREMMVDTITIGGQTDDGIIDAEVIN